MTGHPSEGLVAEVLRARTPSTAPIGLRDWIVEAAETTPQLGRLPWPLAPLVDANPVARRRAQLVLVALLLAVGLVAAAAVGALLDRQRRAIDPPADLAAYIDTAYRHLAELPAFRMSALVDDDPHVFYSDGAGILRVDQPRLGISRIVSLDRVVELGVNPNGEAVAVEEGPSGGVPGGEIGGRAGQPRTCEVAPRYRGADVVAGRPAHRIACGPLELWYDVETGLLLRFTRPGEAPAGTAPPDGGPSAAPLSGWVATELVVGPQPSELFSFDPPGYRHVAADDPACRQAGVGSCTDPGPVTPLPWARPSPAPGAARPADPATVLAAVERAYARVPAGAFVIRSSQHVPGDPTLFGLSIESPSWSDGSGRFRLNLADEQSTVYITADGHNWISYQEDGRTVWRDDWGVFADHGGVGDVKPEFEGGCPGGWRWVGVDLVLGRPADHLGCDLEDLWIDQATSLILRQEVRPDDPLQRMETIWEVVALDLGPQPPDLFRFPSGAVVIPRPSPAPS